VNLSNFFRLHAIIAAVYALGLLLLPATIVGLLTPEPLGAAAIDIARLLGAAHVLIAALAWGASTLESRPARGVAARALLSYAVLGLVITAVGQVQGTWGPLGWSSVALYLLFVAGYGYFLFVRPE
jgi:hypothetical protein